MGIMFAIFSLSGKIPSYIDLFIMYVNGWKCMHGNSSHPGELWLREFITSVTSFSCIGGDKNAKQVTVQIF